MKTRTRKAFSLVELMTVVGIIALLISILLPVLGKAREMGRRTVCLANLRSMAQGCTAYAVNNDGHFPEWGQRFAGFRAKGFDWTWDGILGSPTDPGTGDITSNTRNMWMLVRGKTADPKTFICPSDDEAGEAFIPADITHVYDVQNRSQFSFAVQYQGPSQAAGQTTFNQTNARTGWNTTLKDDNKLVVAADMTPALSCTNAKADRYLFNITTGTDATLQAFADAMLAMASTTATPAPITFNTATSKAEYRVPSQHQAALNSANHRGEGQNIVRLDGSGEFVSNPWAGAHLDNIYTVQDPNAYEDPNNLLPGAAPAVKENVLRARMLGLYEGYTVFPGGTANTYDEAGIMQAWVARKESKSRFPDSFLVP